MQVSTATTNQTPSHSPHSGKTGTDGGEEKPQSPTCAGLSAIQWDQQQLQAVTAPRSKQHANIAENQRCNFTWVMPAIVCFLPIPQRCPPVIITAGNQHELLIFFHVIFLDTKCYINSAETRIFWSPSMKLFEADEPPTRDGLHAYTCFSTRLWPEHPFQAYISVILFPWGTEALRGWNRQ